MDDALLANLPGDPQALKQIIIELSRDRDQQLRQREQRIAEHQQRIAELELQKLRLEHQLHQLKKQYYGPRADRVELGQLLLQFAEQLEARPIDPQDLVPATDVKTARRVRRGRRNLAAFQNLPVTQQVHDLGEDQKPCPCCGQMRQQIGQESSWQIEYIPGHFHRIEHVRIKYACRHCEGEAQNPQITLADKPAQPIERGMAGPGLLAYVATSKYADYLPLYRLEGIFARNGLEIDRGTLCLWMADVAELVRPVYRRMVQRVLESHLIATDDTVMPMLQPGKAKQARMWVYVGDEDHPYNVFDFTLSRSRDGPALFLADYNQVLLADAYGGYDGICLQKAMVKAGCWAHARRKFVDVQDLGPALAAEVLALMGKLFAIEAQARALSAADRLSTRREQSAPVVEQLYARLLEHKQQLLPKHPLAGAIGYVLNQWKPLTAFLSDGAIPLDNNVSEREMKRVALLRKNALFAGNERGGRTAAVLSSLTSTCRRHGIDPQFYFTQLLTNLPAWPIGDIDHWLPDVWKRHQPVNPPQV